MTTPTVLLVDDEVDAVIAPLLTAFSTVGISVDTASTWDDAIDEFLVGGHSLVLADWNLPGSKNGLLLLAQLKLMRPHTRLVLFSGYLDGDQRALVEELPFVDRAISKGMGLTRELVAEARLAVSERNEAIDWAKFASSYRAAADTDITQVERLEQILRTGEVPS